MSTPMQAAESGPPDDEVRKAPTLQVNQDSIVCVEHPCIIKNLDRGISSLGGDYAIDQLFRENRRPHHFEASLRPDDIMSKTNSSMRLDVNHLVLKVTVPKRTGCKRKRGTNGPFLSEEELQNASANGSVSPPSGPVAAETVLRSMQDNASECKVEVVGKIKDTHRFRSLPEFQYATSTNSLMQDMRDSVMTSDLEKIKDLSLNMSRTLAEGQDVGPPPFFLTIKQPFNYSYRQNMYSKIIIDQDGNRQVINTTAAVKQIRHNIDPEAPTVPTEPPSQLAPLETMAPKVQEAAKQLRKLFEQRPLMQRRVLVNMFFGSQNENEIKVAIGYCGYSFTSGPYRDIVIKFGVDPRTDPKYRIYQSVAFQLEDDSRGAADDPGHHLRKVGGKRMQAGAALRARVRHSHIFDGKKFYKDGKVWQVCDVTDPFLRDLLETSEIRKEPDMMFSGWYSNATWAIFRRLMKYKMHVLGEGKVPNDEICAVLAAMFPSHIDENNVHLTKIEEPGSFLSQSDYADYAVDTEISGMAAEVRALAMAANRVYEKHKAKRAKAGEDHAMVDADDGTVACAEKGVDKGGSRRGSAGSAASDEALLGIDEDSEQSDELDESEDEE